MTSHYLIHNDLKAVAKIHMTALSESGIAQLGPDFVFLIYRAIDKSDNSFLIVAYRKEEIVGFIAGGVGLGAIYRNLLLTPLQLIRSLCSRTINFISIAKIIFLPLRKISENNNKVVRPKAELFTLAVSKEYRRLGIAEQLFEKLEERFIQMGVFEFSIMVGSDLSGAQAFYESQGSKKIGIMNNAKNKSSIVYKHKIRPKKLN